MQIGIDLEMIIHAEDKDITFEEADKFNDAFVELVVDSFGWACGGGLSMVDVDVQEDPLPRRKTLLHTYPRRA